MLDSIAIYLYFVNLHLFINETSKLTVQNWSLY